jgi:hypothetical protein
MHHGVIRCLVYTVCGRAMAGIKYPENSAIKAQMTKNQARVLTNLSFSIINYYA